ncbi:MAG TPA: glycosyltransferase family 1 protein [Pseudomonas sp.]|uniref:glycosyltransferase family 1 protein n=1 Tax=Pseudomonas sp. TaxID=306 RepID=UPI002BED161E|nr:glycosyltransferase family 1 protein [Pseudomonas sp.]HTO18609.1 glycosyltransferase family 1 protein [Pseudomonas sp.]HUH38639.1 glycosyltransferase family 1 protein [Spongiibacteraceae bacterium]
MNREEPLEPPRLSPLNREPLRAARPRATLLCLSHLRWGFVYQRPQHLMSRLAADYDVLFFEEPIFEGHAAPRLESHAAAPGVTLLVPQLPAGMHETQAIRAQRELLDGYLAKRQAAELLLWYFTPMSLAFTGHLQGQVVIFDCMDELSAFRHAPPALVDMERRLMTRADVVFTGGHSLWEAKRRHHANIHAVPSSVDVAHFAAARQPLPEPADQAAIPGPRLGFFGVIDERFDIQLLSELAAQRPDWNIVLVGPVVKIDPATLPRLPNIHYLGAKPYGELPSYLSGWDVALMPFALNESTRFISPTKTPEYLAGGRPVVSTPIRDVIKGYGDSGVVSIAATPQGFIEAIEAALRIAPEAVERLADQVLDGMSWDKTCATIRERIECLR